MSSKRHARVKALFLAACEMPPDERADFLGAECGSDEALADRVSIPCTVPNDSSRGRTMRRSTSSGEDER